MGGRKGVVPGAPAVPGKCFAFLCPSGLGGGGWLSLLPAVLAPPVSLGLNIWLLYVSVFGPNLNLPVSHCVRLPCSVGMPLNLFPNKTRRRFFVSVLVLGPSSRRFRPKRGGY